MKLKADNKEFIRFLKDERFIEWKLFPTDELNEYWEKFMEQFPEEHENIMLAEKYFHRIKLSSYRLPVARRREAMDRLSRSLYIHRRKRHIRHLSITGAASLIVLLVVLFYINKEFNQRPYEWMTSSGYIVGNELESEDIIIVAGDKTASFNENVDIEIAGDKTVRIKTNNDMREEIAVSQHSMNKLIVPYGKRSKISLPDGTQLWVNSGSSLEFPSAFVGNTRDVRINGEMYIEVAPDKDKPFYVHTSDFKVKVYGTKFNISNYAGSPGSVVLVEGSIGLRSADQPELLLSPDEQAIYSDSATFHIQKVDVKSFVSWKDGYLSFEDTPMVEALKRIGRYYNLSFSFSDYESFHGLTCTGKIILADNLDSVMITLALLSATKYKREDNQIYIYKE